MDVLTEIRSEANLDKSMSRYFDVSILINESIAERVHRIVLERADGQPFKVHPGQFFMAHFDHDGADVSRSYSAAWAESSGFVDQLELCISLVDGGIGSARVSRASVGDVWSMSGPHGRFVLRGEPEHIVLVATGTGIAPFRAMRTQLEERLQSGARVDLVMGVRRETDLLFDEEFMEFAAQHADFHYHPCCTRPEDEKAFTWRGGRMGRVQVALDDIPRELGVSKFYLCGNPDMITSVKTMLMDAGFDRADVRTETFVSPTEPK